MDSLIRSVYVPGQGLIKTNSLVKVLRQSSEMSHPYSFPSRPLDMVFKKVKFYNLKLSKFYSGSGLKY